MNPLVFSIPDETACEDRLQLDACSSCEITESMWEDLAAHIAAQRTQIPVPAAILAQRCQEGYAAVVASCGRIAAYTSLSPIAEHPAGAHPWTAITAAFSIRAAVLPETSPLRVRQQLD